MKETIKDKEEKIVDLEFRLSMKERDVTLFKTMFVLSVFFLLVVIFISSSQTKKLEDQIKGLNETCNISLLDNSMIQTLEIGNLIIVNKNGTVFKMSNFSMEYNSTRIAEMLLDVSKLGEK